MLFANSSAIITDAFPADKRGLGLGINNTAAIAGSFIGLVLGGVLAPLQWHLVFLISVPFGILGTLVAYIKLKERGVRTPAKIDWLGNVTFAVGLILVLIGITYGLLPYGGHSMGWTNPKVLVEIFGGIVVLCVRLRRDKGDAADVPALPLPHPRLLGRQRGQLPGLTEPGRPDVHADHLAAGDLASAARVQLLRRRPCGRAST